MTPTIHDVARVAGVSIKTVSRVTNGENSVAPRTVTAVNAAIRQLNYHPNHAARQLRTGASHTIGVVVDSLADPFFARLISVFEERALAKGMDILVASTGADGDRAQTQIARLVRRNVRGLIVTPFGEDAAKTLPLPDNLPTVLVDRRGGIDRFDSIRVEDEAGARAAVEHLLSHRHRRIAFIGVSPSFSTANDRLAGYQQALLQAGAPRAKSLIESVCEDRETAIAVTDRMLALKNPPTAIFAASPLPGEGVIKALQRAGRSDVALVIFGDFPLADLLVPAITVIDQDPTGLAHAAMDRLEARIGGDDRERTDIVLPTRLVVRGSGEVPPPGVGGIR